MEAENDAAPNESGEPSPAASGVPVHERYPMRDLPFVAEWMPDDDRFAEAVEEFLLGYGHNTARAYLADLVDIYEWAEARGLGFFDLTEADLKPYLALLRRRKYSESTIRRRLTAFRGFECSGTRVRKAFRFHAIGVKS